MRILVTGGAGYVGSHAARLLDRAGHEVWIYDNLVFGHRSACKPGRLIEGELLDSEKLQQVMRDKSIEAVMHFAAFAYVGESVQYPHKYYQNNIVASLSLLESMRMVGVDRIVFSSTTATYGEPETCRLPKPNVRTRSIRTVSASWWSSMPWPTTPTRTVGGMRPYDISTRPGRRRTGTSARIMIPKRT